MKAKVLKSFYPPTSPNGPVIYNISSGEIRVGQIIEVDVPIGGPIKEVSYKTKKLIVGTDVELIRDNNTNPLPPNRPNSMKARLLKDFGTKDKGMLGGFNASKGDIIDVDVPDGGNKVYTFNSSNGKRDLALTIGTDVELILDEPKKAIVTKEQKGGLLFYGALAVLGYIVYRVLTTK